MKTYEEILNELNENYRNYNYEYFENLASEIIEFETENGRDVMTSTDFFENVLPFMSPEDAFNMGRNMEGSLSDEVFAFNGYGNIETYNNWKAYFYCEMDDKEFAKWLAER